MTTQETELTLDRIDAKLTALEGLLQLMVALRLVEHGHAPDLKAAMPIARDLDRLREIYPEPKP